MIKQLRHCSVLCIIVLFYLSASFSHITQDTETYHHPDSQIRGLHAVSALLPKLDEPIVISIVACGSPQSKYVSMLKRLLLSIVHNKDRHDHYKIYILYDPVDVPEGATPNWILCPYNTTQTAILLNKLHYRHKVHVKFTPIPASIGFFFIYLSLYISSSLSLCLSSSLSLSLSFSVHSIFLPLSLFR